MNKIDIKRKIITALKKLFKNDDYLLENDANERSISHKLAEHLQYEFPKWHVDYEYNRDLDKIKRVDFKVPEASKR